jgi:hypothetical protein
MRGYVQLAYRRFDFNVNIDLERRWQSLREALPERVCLSGHVNSGITS